MKITKVQNGKLCKCCRENPKTCKAPFEIRHISKVLHFVQDCLQKQLSALKRKSKKMQEKPSSLSFEMAKGAKTFDF